MLLLMWLWRRPAAAAPLQPLAWELPYATGAAIKQTKNYGGDAASGGLISCSNCATLVWDVHSERAVHM